MRAYLYYKRNPQYRTFSVSTFSSVAKSSAFKNSISIRRVVEITQIDWQTGPFVSPHIRRRAGIDSCIFIIQLISIKNVTQEFLKAIEVTHADKT